MDRAIEVTDEDKKLIDEFKKYELRHKLTIASTYLIKQYQSQVKQGGVNIPQFMIETCMQTQVQKEVLDALGKGQLDPLYNLAWDNVAELIKEN